MKKRLTSNSYKKLAEHYDDLTNLQVFEKYKSIIGEVKDLRILDLGCGTGTLLNYYSSKNDTHGIDKSEEMIKIAKKKDKKTIYSVGDIKNFKFSKKFDIIICSFDTINHLENLREWGSLFKSASANLNESGFFLFDFNTIKGFSDGGCPIIFKKSDGNYFIMRTKVDGQICFWIIDLFIKKSEVLFEHEEIIIKERSYPNKLIIEKVKKYFPFIKIIKNKDSSRMYIKAKKEAAQ